MNNHWLTRLQTISLWLVIFLIPWQARYFYYNDQLNNQTYDLGQLGWYLSAGLIIITWLLWLPRIKLPHYFWTIGGLVLAWVGLSINWAPHPWLTLYYGSLVLLATLFWLITRSADGVLMLRALVWSGAVQAVLALYQFSTQFISANSWLGMAEHNPHVAGQSVIIFHGIRLLRSYGVMPHPNMLAGFIAISIIAFWLLSLRRVPSTMKFHLMWCGLSSLLYLGLLVTFSRAALIALLAAWLILWFATHHRGFTSARSMLHYGFVLGIAIVLLVNFTNQGILFQRWDSYDRLEQLSVQERLSGWSQWIHVMQSRPERWLIGVGPYNYLPSLAQTYSQLPVWAYQPVHNIYALLIAEWGLAGIIMIVSLVYWVYSRIKHRHWDILAAASPLIALALMGLVDHWIITSYSGLLLVALSLGLVRHKVYN